MVTGCEDGWWAGTNKLDGGLIIASAGGGIPHHYDRWSGGARVRPRWIKGSCCSCWRLLGAVADDIVAY